MKSLILLVIFAAPFARADTIVTRKGEKFERAIVLRTEPDGLIISHATGVAKIPFEEVSKELRDKYHYDAAAAEKFISAQKTVSPPAPTQPPTKTAIKSVQTIEPERLAEPTPSESPVPNLSPVNQLDDSQFDDLRRRDWYEDLKAQEKLRGHANFMLELTDTSEKAGNRGFEKCTPTFFKMLADERKAHRENYKALAVIAAKIIQTKNYDDYRKIKAAEDLVLAEIETQKIIDHNYVMELRTRVSERDATLLEITQQYQ